MTTLDAMARDSLAMRAGGALRKMLAGSRNHPLSALASLCTLVLTVAAGWRFLSWATVDAVWTGNVTACAAAKGACWPMIAAEFRYILFGAYPYDEQWRPAISVGLFVVATLASSLPGFWGQRLILFWTAILALFFLFLAGGVPGLPAVPLRVWAGLPLTLTLSIVCSLLALPLGVGLALGRRSPIKSLQTACTVYIEVIRGVPLITVLFMSSVMLPLFMPAGTIVDGTVRAIVAIWLFTAAYIAEVLRGGLQAVPRGQFEAAAAFGLAYWKTTVLIVLPQALRVVIPPLVNTFIEVFKDTTLVIIVGLFDLLNTTKTSVLDIAYRPYYVEAYVFAGAIYFFFCFYMSHVSQLIERRLARSHSR